MSENKKIGASLAGGAGIVTILLKLCSHGDDFARIGRFASKADDFVDVGRTFNKTDDLFRPSRNFDNTYDASKAFSNLDEGKNSNIFTADEIDELLKKVDDFKNNNR